MLQTWDLVCLWLLFNVVHCTHETMCCCDCYVSIVSSYNVVNMRPHVFRTVVCQLSHPTVLQTWDHVCLWLSQVNGIILNCCKHQTMCVSYCYVSWSHPTVLYTWDRVCLWLLCVMVSSEIDANMRPCVFVTVMCHGLILQCCKHETMCVCDCHVSWSHPTVLYTWDHVCLWLSCVMVSF